jgi:hypothetical protein
MSALIDKPPAGRSIIGRSLWKIPKGISFSGDWLPSPHQMSEEKRNEAGPDNSTPPRIRCDKCWRTVASGESTCKCGWFVDLPDFRWNPHVPQAYVLHWMAQCHRKLHYPLDESERGRWPAFDYAWRTFNYLYNQITPGTSRDMARIRASLEQTDTELLLIRLREIAARFAKGTSDPAVDRFALLDSESDHVLAITKLEKMLSTLGGENDQSRESVTQFIKEIYTARHARVHGHVQAGVSLHKTTEEIVLLDWMIESISDANKFLLVHLSDLKEPQINAYILSRVFQLLKQIAASMHGIDFPVWVQRGRA